LQALSANTFLSPAKCLVSHFKPGPFASAITRATSGDPSAQRIDSSVFKDIGGQQEDEPGVASRIISTGFVFAEKASAAFDSSCFESRKSCLRQVMKCAVAAEQTKNPSLTVDEIHETKGAMVLEIVQVHRVITCTRCV
jgi:hypothetical protein